VAPDHPPGTARTTAHTQTPYPLGRSGLRADITVERSAVQLRGDRAITTVALIHALGGGWDEPAADVNVRARH